MRGALRALLVKELSQHGMAMLLLAGVLMLTFILYGWQLSASARMLSVLELVPKFALLPMIIAALVLGHRLVVTEYYGRTQRFVETLPVRAGRMEGIKYLLGLTYLLAVAAAVLADGAATAHVQEPLDARFLAIMGARLCMYVFALWSFVFAMGFLGRLRIPLYALLALMVVMLDNLTGFELSRFGPLAAMDARTFPFERQHFPARALLECACVGALFTVLGFILARMREGSLVEQLARPMSYREKAFLFTLLVAGLLALATVGEKALQRPYRFTSAHVLRGEDATLAIAYLDEDGLEPARAVFDSMEPRLAQLWQALEVPPPPPMLRIALTPSSRPDLFETAYSDPDEGVAVEANFSAKAGFHDVDLGAYAIHELLDAYSGGRALFEPRHWLLDGFSSYWAQHGAGAPDRLGERVEPSVLRAMVAARQIAPVARSLHQWDRTSERLGYPMADAFAYLALRVLVQQRGQQALLDLVRATVARPPRNPIAQWWQEKRQPTRAVFEQATGWRFDEFERAWQQQLESLERNPRFAAALARVPRARARIHTQPGTGGTQLIYQLSLNPPPRSSEVCTFLHLPIGPVDTPVDTRSMQMSEHLWPAGAPRLEHTLPPHYGAGERVIAAVDCELGELGAPLRLGVRRMSLQ